MSINNNRLLYVALVCCRLVNSTGTSTERLNSPDLTFGTRTGSRKGVEAHLFRAETPRELAHWCRSIIEGAHSAATLIKEINCGEYSPDISI